MKRRLVSTPKTFFVKERDQFYSDWMLSFWREFFQNSVDAGAKNVSIRVDEADERGSFDEVKETSSKVTRIVFEDDGHGMTADVLDRVYFAIGQTTKEDGSSTGGYGRARIMTCFSQNRYSILTTDRFVLGDGPDYVNYSLGEAEGELSKAAEALAERDDAEAVRSREGLEADLAMVREAKEGGGFPGCRVEVDVDLTDRWYSATPDRMLGKLREYLSESQLPCAVTVNGQTPEKAFDEATKLQARRGPVRKTLSAVHEGEEVEFATIHTSEGAKAGHKGKLIVRVDGASMFSQHVEGEVQVILEIDKALSRTVMNSNRDSLKSPFRDVVEAFVAEMNVDRKTALADLESRKRFTIEGRKGTMKASPPAGHEITRPEMTEVEFESARRVVEFPKPAKIETVDQLRMRGLSQDVLVSFMRDVYGRQGLLKDVFSWSDGGWPLADEARSFASAAGSDWSWEESKMVDLFLRLAPDRLKEWVVSTLVSREEALAAKLREENDHRLKEMNDVHVSIVSTNDRTRAAVRRNDPRRWDVETGKGRAPRALLSAWTAACAVAVETLVKLRPALEGFEWTTGWVYSVPEETHQGDAYRMVAVKAMCRNEDGKRFFLLNPVNDDGTLRYSVSDAKDRQRLQALAMHEVAHAIEKGHNEIYAGILTDLMEEFDTGDATRRMKDAVRGVMAAYEQGRARVQAMDSESGPRPAERLMAYASGNRDMRESVTHENGDGTWSVETSDLADGTPERGWSEDEDRDGGYRIAAASV